MTRRGDDNNGGTHHLPPASRATAHGVDHRWNDDEAHDSTLDHHHEPLLVGWKGVLHEVQVCERVRRRDRDKMRSRDRGEPRRDTRDCSEDGEGFFHIFVFFVL
jgi:hypothetical protein